MAPKKDEFIPDGFIPDAFIPDAPVQSERDRRANMTPGQLAIDGAQNAVRGVAGAVTGIPGMIGEAVGMGKDALSGNASGVVDRARNFLNGMGRSIADPISQTLSGAAELAVPGISSDADPSNPLWGKAQQDAGGQLGSALVAKAAGKIPTDAQGLRGLADKARAYSEANPVVSTIEQTDVLHKPLTAVGNVVRAGKSAGAQVVAPAADLAAKARNFLDDPYQYSGTTPAPSPEHVPQTELPPQDYQMPWAGNSVPAATPGPEVPFQGLPADPYVDPLGDIRQSTPSAGEIPFTMLEEPVVDPFAGNMRQSSGPAQEIPFNPPVSNVDPFAGNMREPSPAPQEIPFQGFPPEAPSVQPQMPVNPDVVSMQQQIRPTGNAAQTWVARNATKLYDLMPELRDVPMGEKFRTLATNGFKNFEAVMKAAQDSVPPTTMVPKSALVEDLLPIKADAAMANRPGVLRILDKLDDAAPSIPWKQFLDIKEGIRKSPGFASDPYIRKAYGAFMDAASKVSPEIAKANKDFSMAMRLLEYSKIDPISGQFLRSR